MNAADLATRPVEPWFVVDSRELTPLRPQRLYPGAMIEMLPASFRTVPRREPFPCMRALLAVEDAPGRE